MFAPVERGQQFVTHLGGRLTADVIAFQQDLAASAGAHHAMAQVFEACVGIASAHENKHRDHECGGLQAANGPELLWPQATAELRSAWTGEGARPHTSH